MKRVGFNASDDLHAQATAIAKSRQLPLSTIALLALEEFVVAVEREEDERRKRGKIDEEE